MDTLAMATPQPANLTGLGAGRLDHVMTTMAITAAYNARTSARWSTVKAAAVARKISLGRLLASAMLVRALKSGATCK
jgi:hypothetical protein